MQLDLDIARVQTSWSQIPIEDPRASAFYDRHYSRQTKGARGVLGPGWRFLLWHETVFGAALWGVLLNRFDGEWRWRNAIFRNESGTRSSDLIVDATNETFVLWLRRYRMLPEVPLETEIDIDATAAGRSPWHRPGHCYHKAGWLWVRSSLRNGGRSRKAVYQAQHFERIAA